MLDSTRIEPVNCWDLNLRSTEDCVIKVMDLNLRAIEDCVIEVMDHHQEASCKKLFDDEIL